MAKKTFNINKRSKPMSEVVKEFEGEAETIEAVKIFEKQPSIENKEKAIAAVQSDPSLVAASPEILNNIQDLFIKAFSANTLPSDYSDLKREAKYLADLNQVSGLYMAQRLVIIRDNNLYEKDGYLDFRAFIESELKMSRSTVYNYIDIVEVFLEAKTLDADIEKISTNRSKVIPFLPILKSDKITDIEKESIKASIIEKLDIKSAREMSAEAKDLKVEYGLVNKPVNKTKAKGNVQLSSSLTKMFESIKLLSHPKANDAFLLVLEHLEMDKLITGKELGILAKEFNKTNIDLDV